SPGRTAGSSATARRRSSSAACCRSSARSSHCRPAWRACPSCALPCSRLRAASPGWSGSRWPEKRSAKTGKTCTTCSATSTTRWRCWRWRRSSTRSSDGGGGEATQATPPPMLRDSPSLHLRHALALGLAQGPTELLPVSSSAHTTLIPLLAGWPYAELDDELRKSFEVALHAGAGLALALDMRGELIEAAAELNGPRVVVIALALAPPALAGLTLRAAIERRFGGPRSIAAGLAAVVVSMALADVRPARRARRRQDACPRD